MSAAAGADAGAHAGAAPSAQPVRTAGPAKWSGPTRHYDLVKEFALALVAVSALVLVLAAVFSSPDEKQVTLRDWARAAPADFVATATGELAGTTTSATYGPPYNRAGTGQQLGPLSPQRAAGVRHPVNSADDFVIRPLRTVPGAPSLRLALAAWDAASPAGRTAWASAYADALGKAPDGDPARVTGTGFGPVPALTAGELAMASSGALDAQLVTPGSGFYLTDYTRAGLFLADGAWFDDLAGQQHLHGDQWGMINETGSYPGQIWLIPVSFWYQISPFSTSDNADIQVMAVVAVISLFVMLIPLIPGVRSIPRLVPVYRLIWRRWYAEHGR
jgi:hypothetical protein